MTSVHKKKHHCNRYVWGQTHFEFAVVTPELLLAICSEQLIPVSFSPWCLVDFSTSVSSVYCLLWVRAERDCCTTHSGVSLRALQPGIEGSVCVEPKLERDRSPTKRLEKTYRYLRYITDQCRARTLRGHVSSVVGCGNPTNVRGKRCVRASRLHRNRTFGSQFRVFARSGECGNVNRARLSRAILAVCVLVVE